LEDQDCDGKIILKWIYRGLACVDGRWIELAQDRPVAGFDDSGVETPCCSAAVLHDTARVPVEVTWLYADARL
jgi:hypothetical protein